MANSPLKEVQALTDRWALTTYQVLHQQLKKFKIGQTDQLWLSIRDKVTTKSWDVKYDLSFLSRGRYRDMGAGSRAKIETKENRDAIIKRKPRWAAKWYSRPFYGRLNMLRGALGYQLMEETVKSITNGITENGGKRG